MPKVKTRNWNHLWCCNPFGVEKHASQVCKRKVTSAMCKKVPHLVVGDGICERCRLKISKIKVYEDAATESEVGKSTSEEECLQTEAGKSTSEEEYAPESKEDVNIGILNKLLTPLGESPISKRKLSRAKSYAQKKATSVNEAIKRDIFHVGGEISEAEEMISQFKEKFSHVKTANEKYQILTCLPRSWSEYKIISEFGVSPYVAHIAKVTQTSKGIMSFPDRKYQRNLPDDVIQIVKQFYEEDDISRIMPGMKDTKSVREGDKKVKKQKRLLLSNLKELYREFKLRQPNCKIGFSRFASLRPKYCVLAGQPGTHNVCVCTICENTKLMYMSVKPCAFLQSESRVENINDLILKMVCNNPSPNCFLDNCKECPGSENLSEMLTSLLGRNLIEEITYKKWTTTDRANMILVKVDSTNFIKNFIDWLKKFKVHNFISKSQANYLKQLKNEIKPGEFIIIGDFSENYSFIIQDAIQGYHWSNSQATIHPFTIYFRNSIGGDLENLCFSVISEYLVHDSATVHVFQKKVIEYLKQTHNEIHKIFYFSDGAAGQYKNKKNFVNLLNHEHDFEIPAEWHFFATSHGKGPSDGIGGTIKRLAANASLQGTLISTPKDLYEWSKCNIKGINVSFTSIEEHEEVATNLNSHRFADLKTVPGTRSVHCVVPVNGKLATKTYSASPETPKLVEIRRVTRRDVPRSDRQQ